MSASTQDQALSALLFLYRYVLGRDVGELGEVIRARKPKRLPVVLTRTEVTAVFWLSFMASRLFTAFVLGPLTARIVLVLGLEFQSEALLILVLALAGVGITTGVVRSRSQRTAITLVIAAGLVFGPIFPSIMAILLGHFPGAVQGRAVGMLFAIGGLGWTLIPMSIGAYAEGTTVQRGSLIAVGSAIALCIVAALLTTTYRLRAEVGLVGKRQQTGAGLPSKIPVSRRLRFTWLPGTP